MPKWSYDPVAEEFKGDALYFIQEGAEGPIKIGRGDPQSRLCTLQIGNPRELRIRGILPDQGYTEAFWHRAFAWLAIRGEWFAADRQLVSAIHWALGGTHWADEIVAPEGVDQRLFGERMLDALEWYEDMVFDGESEGKAANVAVAWARREAWKETLEGATELFPPSARPCLPSPPSPKGDSLND